jgi:hypothetical protein
MPNCGPSMLIISRPSSNQKCGVNCDTGPADCLQSGLSPRRNRGKVIEQIKDYVLLMLGAPVVSVELDDQQLDMAVKQTLKVMEYYAPMEYFRYHTFLTTPGKSVYEMPADVGYVRDVSYRQTSEFSFTAQDLGGAIPIEYFYPGGAYASIQGGMMDPIQPMGEWANYKSYERMYSRLSSGMGGWEYVGGYRYIKLYPIPFKAYRVIVHYMQRCNDWDEVTLAMQEGSLIHAQLMLGAIRKKYQGTFGPGGGFSLDTDMYQTAKQDYLQWKEDLIYRWGDILGPSMGGIILPFLYIFYSLIF